MNWHLCNGSGVILKGVDNMYMVVVKPNGERIYKRATLMSPKCMGKKWGVTELRKEIVKQDKEDIKGDN